MLLSRAEGSLQVVVGVGLGEFAEVHEIGPGQGHRPNRQQAGSRASGQRGRKTSLSELPPPPHGEGQEGRPLAQGKQVCSCMFVHFSVAVRAA